MKKNMGYIDRIARFLFAVAVGVLYFTNLISGTAAIVLGILAVVFILTSLSGFCPLYAPFKIKSCKSGQCE